MYKNLILSKICKKFRKPEKIWPTWLNESTPFSLSYQDPKTNVYRLFNELYN